MDKQNKSEKSQSNGISLGTSLGMLIGVAIGCWTENLSLWLPVAAAVGMSLGTVYDSKSKKNDREK